MIRCRVSRTSGATGASASWCAVASWLAVLAVFAALAPAPAGAHIVYGRPTLMALVGGAELVARVEVLDADHPVVIPPGHEIDELDEFEDLDDREAGLQRLDDLHGLAPHAHAEDGAPVSRSPEQRPAVRVKLREVLKGPGAPGDELVFAAHGHGVAEYADGEDALVFLVPIERSRELAALSDGGVRWVSFQEHDARLILEGAAGAHALEAARRYAAAGALADPEARLAALRDATLAALLSGDPRSMQNAVQDFALTGPLELVTAEQVPPLRSAVIENEAAPIGVRVTLLVELGRRGLLETTPIWLAMLRDAPPSARRQVIRAAGLQRAPEVEAALVGLLEADDPTSEAAALALGHPHHANAVPGLAAALQHDAPRVRMAAIRSLGRIPTPEARRALEAAAAEHPDPATQRRAEAEVRRIDAASG